METKKFLRNLTLALSAIGTAACAPAPVALWTHQGRIIEASQDIHNYCIGAAESSGKFGMELKANMGVRVGSHVAISEGNGKLRVEPNDELVHMGSDGAYYVDVDSPTVKRVRISLSEGLNDKAATRAFFTGNCSPLRPVEIP